MSFHLKLIVFVVASGAITWVSWRPLRDLRSHGFYRFFAFEAILLLILLNLDYWFNEPLSYRQLVSWLLLAVSLFLVVHSALLLRRLGRLNRERRDPSLIGIEKTTELVTTGAYCYIRHPMYSSGVVGIWGVFLKHPSWLGVCLAVLTVFFFYLTARMEEAENISFFGDTYRDYMKRTKMFVPFLF
ncbi:MAG: isoprenylcysteine carboxylmethyltransferase family protein [bacterium]